MTSAVLLSSGANAWLDRHPIVLGLLAIALGLVLALSGAHELKTGVTHSKYGARIEGSTGRLVSWVRVLFGVCACLFGLYKCTAG